MHFGDAYFSRTTNLLLGFLFFLYLEPFLYVTEYLQAFPAICFLLLIKNRLKLIWAANQLNSFTAI